MPGIAIHRHNTINANIIGEMRSPGGKISASIAIAIAIAHGGNAYLQYKQNEFSRTHTVNVSSLWMGILLV